LLLLIVTAAPLAGFTDPVELMRMSPEALVVCGVVTAVLITVSAFAGAVVSARTTPRPVEARNTRIKVQTPLERLLPLYSLIGRSPRLRAEPDVTKAAMVWVDAADTIQLDPRNILPKLPKG
jgi:hypothetical protein